MEFPGFNYFNKEVVKLTSIIDPVVITIKEGFIAYGPSLPTAMAFIECYLSSFKPLRSG